MSLINSRRSFPFSYCIDHLYSILLPRCVCCTLSGGLIWWWSSRCDVSRLLLLLLLPPPPYLPLTFSPRLCRICYRSRPPCNRIDRTLRSKLHGCLNCFDSIANPLSSSLRVISEPIQSLVRRSHQSLVPSGRSLPSQGTLSVPNRESTHAWTRTSDTGAQYLLLQLLALPVRD